MINAVGGTSIHWMTQSWRYLPWNFKIPSESRKRYARTRSRRTRPRSTGPSTTTSSSRTTTSTSTSPACPARPGTFGDDRSRGNIYEGPRRRPYPLPALRSSGWTEMTDKSARAMGWHPYPGPAGIRSKAYRGKAGCTYCGFCGSTGCLRTRRFRQTSTTSRSRKTKNLKVVTMATCSGSKSTTTGKASGVLYLKGGREYFQPARVVLLAV